MLRLEEKVSRYLNKNDRGLLEELNRK